MNYHDFIKTKFQFLNESGFITDSLPDYLFDFQQHIVSRSIQLGRSAIFVDCGLGKTPMQIAWARIIYNKTRLPVLIVAPLGVAIQTSREAHLKFGESIPYSKNSVDSEIIITNYENVVKFDKFKFGGIIIDESSILKSFTGSVRNYLITNFNRIPYRLACTATPSPNDYMELGNHAEFLGVCKRSEMLSEYFVHDGGDTSKWRLKKHGKKRFWQWIGSWSSVLRSPEDIGYCGQDFILPALNINQHYLKASVCNLDMFGSPVQGLSERRVVKRESIKERVKYAESLLKNTGEQWIIWTQLNKESESFSKIQDAVEITGSMTLDEKQSRIIDFVDGKFRVLVTKPKIAGFGMNFQQCSKMIFGAIDSYESFYQCVRRCYRFGQTKEVDVHIVADEREEPVVRNMMNKSSDHNNMMDSIIQTMKENAA